MRRFLTPLIAVLSVAAVGWAALAPAWGQGANITVNPQRRQTYSISTMALAPAAATTDFLTLTGSATQNVWVISAGCSGVSTANATATIVALKRSTANAAGTSTAPTRVPHDSTDPAATATGLAYTANPTTGTLVGNLRAGKLATNTAATSSTGNSGISWQFGGDGYSQPIVLRGTTQVFALNGAAGTFSAGTALDCWITWSE